MNKKYNKVKKLPIYLLSTLIIGLISLLWVNKVESPIDNILKSQTEDLTSQNEKASLTTISSQIGEKASDKPIISELKIPILMYHYIRIVEDENDTLGTNLSVTPEKFAEQLEYLQSRGYKTITFYDIDAGRIPDKPVILTFDDGYKDFFENAYPLLKSHNMTAVSFIIVNKIGADGYMTNEEISELSRSNFEIGSHTLSHPDLAKTNLDKTQTEIVESKREIEELIHQPVLSFCYPAGKYNDDVVSAIKSADYKYGTTTNIGIGDLGSNLLLSRYRMNSDSNIKSYIK